jgi:hypothetical protein
MKPPGHRAKHLRGFKRHLHNMRITQTSSRRLGAGINHKDVHAPTTHPDNTDHHRITKDSEILSHGASFHFINTRR